MKHCLMHAIQCRKEVLADLTKYNINPSHRTTLEANLQYFQQKLTQEETK